MKIIDFNTIVNLNISPFTFLEWTENVWMLKDTSILPSKIKMWEGEYGRHICMPCVIPTEDIAGVKLISRNIKNINEYPARNSNIMLQKCSETGFLAAVDGLYITNMRTGAVAVYSLLKFAKNNFTSMGIIGLGLVSRTFMWLLAEVYKKPIKVKLLKYKDQAESFIERFSGYSNLSFEIVNNINSICETDVIVSGISTTNNLICENTSIFKDGVTIIPIHTGGFQNCDLTFDKVIIDDWKHVSEFKYYNIFKDKCFEVADVVMNRKKGRESDSEKIIVYCGGIALHDIYFAKKIYDLCFDKIVDVPMSAPNKRFWI